MPFGQVQVLLNCNSSDDFSRTKFRCWSDDRNGIDYLRYYRNENIQYYDVRVKWH